MKSFSLSLTIFLATAMLMTTVLGAVQPDKWWVFRITVNITNGLTEEKQLRMHCKSKDDDLGDRFLLAEQSWDWTFRVNFKENTLFYCSFDTLVGSGTYTVFDAKRDVDFCPQYCRWIIKDDGAYGYRGRHHNERYFFKWMP